MDASELIRILCMQSMLVPAAYLLPKRFGQATAKFLALLLLATPWPGMTTYVQMSRAFGQGRYRSFLLAWGWLARPFLDYVILKRLQYGREDVSNWKIVERDADRVAGIRESGQSFILASAHFQREALQAISCPRLTPGNFVQVAQPLPKTIRTPYDLRIRLQYGTMLRVFSSAWRRPFEFVFTGTGQTAAGVMFDRLRKQGNIVSIHVDTPWPDSSSSFYSRPFAGLDEGHFSTGVGQLASLTGCPIVGCVYWQDDEGTLIVDWLPPIVKVKDEVDAMNQLFDSFEKAVGERPIQYMFEVGKERRWNAEIKSWQSVI